MEVNRGTFIRNVIFLALLTFSESYVITTPRKWPSDGQSQVCVTLTREQSPGDHISLSLKSGSEVLIDQRQIAFAAGGTKTSCSKISVPSVNSKDATLKINGSLEGLKVDYSKSIAIVGPGQSIKTYVQTDKYLYKPSQTVNIRVLTLEGPFLQVFTGKYPEIWIENPNKSRLKQWLNVDSKGLIHLTFELSDEPTPGTYLVRVRSPHGGTVDGHFKIEDYVLPRFEVTIEPPSYLLADFKDFKYQVCATYTFGQPVKGLAILKLSNDEYGSNRKEFTVTTNFTGCATFQVYDGQKIITRNTYSLQADAEVVEEGTEIILKADRVRTSVKRRAISFEDISVQKYAKSELPYLAEIKATFPDGSPAASELMEVCAGSVCKHVTSSNHGIIKFALPPHLLTETVNIIAVGYPADNSRHSGINMRESSFRKYMPERYHSPTDSSLIIGLTQRKLECLPGKDIEFDLPIWFSASGQSSAMITLQVLSRGQILFADTKKQQLDSGNGLTISNDLYLELPKEPTTRGLVRGSFTIRVVLPRTVSPTAKILVWYPRHDGEIVSDFRSVDVSECLLNEVSLGWSSDQAYPGDEATLTLRAEPHSLCSLGVVDKSVALLQPDEDDITMKRLLRGVEAFAIASNDKNQIDDHEYCRNKMEITTTTTPTPDPSLGRNPNPRFWFPPQRYFAKGKDALHMFNDAGVYVMTDHEIEFRECDRRPHRRYYGNRIGYRTASVGMREEAFGPMFEFRAASIPLRPDVIDEDGLPTTQTPRVYFPETWLWKLSLLSDSGSYVEKLTLPDTVTEWVGKAVCVHPSQGVGISESSSITTFRDFFVDLTLPPTAKRGEVFPVKISVFNYLNEPIPVSVTMLPSAEFDILSDNSPELRTGERQACIGSQDKVVHSILIRPMATGDINITVNAYVDTNSLSNCNRNIRVKRSDTLIKPIRVDFEGFPKEKTFSDYICVSDSLEGGVRWDIAVPTSIVEDSARGFVQAVGDLMGPTIENLGKLVRMPSGCGEQNMIGFAPNIFVMQYLEASQQGSEEIKQNAKSHMESGYKRELNYRHKDGSYSAFGERDSSGSTWLTAFVLKCFAQARPYIFIDTEELEISTNWLKGLQQTDGCFRKEGKVLHKGMKGGVGSSGSPSVLSSFVLISLLEAGESPDDRYVAEAISCIKSDATSHPYALALKAYALTLAKDPEANAVIEQLLGKVTERQGIVKWNTDENLKMGDSLGLETSGYAVLALMETNRISIAVKFIRSMNTQRNGQGGFISTQDTIVALQAMAAYERGLPQSPTDLTVLLDMQGLSSSIAIDESNKLLLQRVEIPSMPTNVTVDVFGQGCALVQAVLRYNVPKPDASEAFMLSVEATTEPDKGCKTKRIRVCASYQLPDLKSNMAIIEVDVMTGYIPDKSDLKQIVQTGSDLFKRYEVDGSKVLFYIDEFSAEEICVSFKVFREFEVEDAKNGTVSVYDYYSPEYAISESYRLPPVTECVDKDFPPRREDFIV